MEIKMRVQAHHFQQPDVVQVQFTALEGQANLNANVSRNDAADYPVGATVAIEVTRADEEE